MRNKRHAIPYIICMGLTLLYLYWALTMEYWTAKIFPLAIIGLTFVLAGVGLGRELFKKQHFSSVTGRQSAAENGYSGVSWRKYAIGGFWLVGFLLVIYILGFIMGIPVFVILFLKTHGTKWASALSFAILAGAFTYGVFAVALGIYFHEGLISPFLKVPVIRFQ